MSDIKPGIAALEDWILFIVPQKNRPPAQFALTLEAARVWEVRLAKAIKSAMEFRKQQTLQWNRQPE